MYVSPIIAPPGQVLVNEPQAQDDVERYSIAKVTGIVAYRDRGPMSTLHWVARC